MTRIFAVSNQKGGVGKTTTSTNLATALSACGKKVLVIDFDPQGNTTTSFNINKSAEKTSYSFIMGYCDIKETICSTNIPGLDIVPSTVHLSGAEVELVPMMAREYRLKEALNSVVHEYDYIFIDCPPSIGLLTLNALAAAKEIIVPVQCEFFAMEGLSQLFQTINLVKKNLNPELSIGGILLTMYDSRTRLSGSVEKDIRFHFKDKVFNTVIPRNVRISEAPSFGKPVLLYDTHCVGSKAYMKLAAELITRNSCKIEEIAA
jgi:chromosome partitioning protein